MKDGIKHLDKMSNDKEIMTVCSRQFDLLQQNIEERKDRSTRMHKITCIRVKDWPKGLPVNGSGSNNELYFGDKLVFSVRATYGNTVLST